MKLTFKSLMKNAFIVLSLVFLAAGCKHDPDISQDTYHLVTPTFKAGDLRCLRSNLKDGKVEDDYYCFTSAEKGAVIVHVYSSSSADYILEKYPFSYENGELSVEGTKNGTVQFGLMMNREFISLYSKENCFTRNDGKKGLIGTFSRGADTITFSKSGTVKLELSGKTFDVKFKNEAGIVSVYDSSSSIEFYYLPDGSLLPSNSTSYLAESDSIELTVTMDLSEEKGVALRNIMKTCPDGFFYSLKNNRNGAWAQIETVQGILKDNPNKKFAFQPGLNGKAYKYGEKFNEIPDDCFKDCTNLYKFTFGNALSSKYKLGKNAFSGCTNLAELVDFDSVYDFGESCFQGCSALKYFSISGDYLKKTYIRPNAFKGCTSLDAGLNSNYKSVTVKKGDGDPTEIFATEIQNKTDGFTNLLTNKYVDYEWTLTKN